MAREAGRPAPGRTCACRRSLIEAQRHHRLRFDSEDVAVAQALCRARPVVAECRLVALAARTSPGSPAGMSEDSWRRSGRGGTCACAPLTAADAVPAGALDATWLTRRASGCCGRTMDTVAAKSAAHGPARRRGPVRGPHARGGRPRSGQDHRVPCVAPAAPASASPPVGATAGAGSTAARRRRCPGPGEAVLVAPGAPDDPRRV